MGSHQIAAAIRREIQPRHYVAGPFQWGVVNAVNTSPKTVDLYLDGSSTLTTGIRYLSSYSPTVDDVVLVGRNGSDRFVLGILA